MMSDAEFEFGYREPDVDPQNRARLEARNSIDLYIAVAEYVLAQTEPVIDREFILRLHRIAVRDLEVESGCFRRRPTFVADHIPPKSRDVPGLVSELCEHANRQTDAFYAAAFVLWRLNWIHPFLDGNGRVARALCYAVLCIISGEVVSGEFLGQLLDRKDEYYTALELADRSWSLSDQDYCDPDVVSGLEILLIDIYGSMPRHAAE